MNDIKKIKTTKTNQEASPIVDDRPGLLARAGTFFHNLGSYSIAGLKIVDVAARVITAAALYLKLDDSLLNWGAAFLGATALYDIVVALFRANGPKRS